MAIKNLISTPDERKILEFISKGGTSAEGKDTNNNELSENLETHRLTLRIPKALMHAIDNKRKEKRVGKISRNLWILEQIEKATR